MNFNSQLKEDKLWKPTGSVLFALPVCVLWERWLIFLIQKIKTGLSVSLRLVPREYALASTSVLASVSHLLHVLHFWPFFLLIRDTDVVLSLFLCCSSDHRQLGLAHGVVCRSDSKVGADWLQCVSNREVQLRILQSQPLTAVIFTVI